MNIDYLVNSIKQERQKIDALTIEARLVADAGSKTKQEIVDLQKTISDLEKAALLLSSISEEKQKEAQLTIESLVTQGLQKIFGPEYTFHVNSMMKGKTPIVEFTVKTKINASKILETSVVDARGAGLASVVGFLLRLVLILLSKKSSLLVLDETFANLSNSYIPKLIEFIREIVDKSNLQILMVTHESQFIEVADKCYKFSLDNSGMTKVETL